MSDWQPIETAPRDGTLVWLYEPHDMGGFMFAGGVCLEGEWINNLDFNPQMPTHWMPLPAPPVSK